MLRQSADGGRVTTGGGAGRTGRTCSGTGLGNCLGFGVDAQPARANAKSDAESAIILGRFAFIAPVWKDDTPTASP